jgi:hypothetical protein
VSLLGASSTDDRIHLRRFPWGNPWVLRKTLCGQPIVNKELPADPPKCSECADIGTDIIVGARK